MVRQAAEILRNSASGHDSDVDWAAKGLIVTPPAGLHSGRIFLS